MTEEEIVRREPLSPSATPIRQEPLEIYVAVGVGDDPRVLRLREGSRFEVKQIAVVPEGGGNVAHLRLVEVR